MDEELQRVPPRIFLGSFVMIAGGYLACRMTEFIVFFTGAKFFWPETWAIYFRQRLTADDMVAQAGTVFPTPLVWLSIAIATIGAVAIGAFIYRRAPFGAHGHVVFLALILFVDFLQQSMQLPALLKWMPLVKMAVYPMALLAGARWMSQQMPPAPLDHENSNHSEPPAE